WQPLTPNLMQVSASAAALAGGLDAIPVGGGGTGVGPSWWTGQGFRLRGGVAETGMAALIVDFSKANCVVDIDVRRKRKALAVGRPGRVNDGPDTCGPIGRGGYQVMGSAG